MEMHAPVGLSGVWPSTIISQVDNAAGGAIDFDAANCSCCVEGGPCDCALRRERPQQLRGEERQVSGAAAVVAGVVAASAVVCVLWPPCAAACSLPVSFVNI